jgi:hypothetical protein
MSLNWISNAHNRKKNGTHLIPGTHQVQRGIHHGGGAWHPSVRR